MTNLKQTNDNNESSHHVYWTRNKETKAKGKQEDRVQSKFYRLYRKQIDEQIDVRQLVLPLDNCDGKVQCTIV